MDLEYKASFECWRNGWLEFFGLVFAVLWPGNVSNRRLLSRGA